MKYNYKQRILRSTLLFGLLIYVLNIHAQNVFIPDTNFKEALIQAGIDTSDDGEIQLEEALIVDSINVTGKYIADFTGIETFKSLTYLNCYSNQLVNLDISRNNELDQLICSDNKLTSLILGNQSNLTFLDCSSNFIKSLDLSHCSGLFNLKCQRNQIAMLDVTQNRNLFRLECNINKMSILILGDNPILTDIKCDHNLLKNIDVSKCLRLEYLYCNSNELTNLDVSKNSKLSSLNCWINKLKFICVNEKQRISFISKDDSTFLNTNCAASGSQIEKQELKVELIKIYDLLGHELSSQELKTGLYIYFYSNGSFVRKWHN